METCAVTQRFFSFLITLLIICGVGTSCYTGNSIQQREVSSYQKNTNTAKSQAPKRPTTAVTQAVPVAPAPTPQVAPLQPRPMHMIPRLRPDASSSVVKENKWRALLVGVSDYQSPDIPDLPAVEGDLLKLDNLLRSEFVFHEVVTLFNENATEPNLRRELNRLRQEATVEDNILIYFGGHGTNPEKRAGVWLMHDTYDLDAQGFSYALMEDFMNYCKARRILVLSDSCYSGAIATRAPGRITEEDLVRDPAVMDALNDVIISNNRIGREIISSGNIEMVADSIPGPCSPHSPFACSLINALESLPDGSVMSSDDLFYEISDRMRGLRTYLPQQPDGTYQTPQFIPVEGHQQGKFLLIRRRGQ